MVGGAMLVALILQRNAAVTVVAKKHRGLMTVSHQQQQNF
jgi:hypothetical protein